MKKLKRHESQSSNEMQSLRKKQATTKHSSDPSSQSMAGSFHASSSSSSSTSLHEDTITGCESQENFRFWLLEGMPNIEEIQNNTAMH